MSLRQIIRPGTGELLYDPSSGLQLELGAFYEAFTKCVGETTINVFRAFFAGNMRVPADMRWVGSPVLDKTGKPIVEIDAFGNTWDCQVTDKSSPIDVGSEFGEKAERYPSVLLSSISGNINDLWLNNQKVGKIFTPNPAFNPTVGDLDAREPQYLEIGERLSGKMELTLTYKVSAYTKPSRDRLVDLVLHALVGPARRDFHRLALNWLPNRGTIGGDEVRDYTETLKIHSRVISFGLQTEWIDDFFYNAVTVKDIQSSFTRSNTPSTQ